jgi:hypothetical protein
MEEWRKVYPEGVALGERLAASRDLASLRKVGFPVAKVIDWIESELSKTHRS